MQKYFDSLVKYPFRKIYFSFVAVITPAFILRFLYPGSDLELALLGPIIEESLKLFTLVLLMGVFRSKGYLGKTWKSEFQVLILTTLLVGVGFSLFELLSSYLHEPAIHSWMRLAAHSIYMLLGIVAALRFWNYYEKPTGGFWWGTSLAVVLHGFYNSAGVFGFIITHQILLLVFAGMFIILPNLRTIGLWTHIPDGWRQASTIQLKVKSKKSK